VAVTLLDSSAVVAYMVEGDTLHESAAHAIESAVRGGASLAISAVTWSEVLHGALLGYFPEEAVRELAADFGIAVLAVDAAVAEAAAALQKEYRETSIAEPRPRLRTPDALILATAEVYADVDSVICGDEKWANVPGVSTEIVLLREP
jgi:predicted nucleic acid-binding protein